MYIDLVDRSTLGRIEGKMYSVNSFKSCRKESLRT